MVAAIGVPLASGRLDLAGSVLEGFRALVGAGAGFAGAAGDNDGRAGLAERPLAAAGSDFFISIHHDSVQEKILESWQWQGNAQTYSDRYIGFSFFVSRQSPDLAKSLRCASTMGARLRRAGFVPATHHADSIAHRPRPYADVANAVHYYDNLVVLYRTTLPAVLFEAGIIKHRGEEMALRDPALQARMADELATGIAACLFVDTLSAQIERALIANA